MSFRLGTWARLALGLCLILVLSIPVMAQDAPTPEPVGARPDAPPYAVHGPYWVGTRTLSICEGGEGAEAHRFTMWYPALNPEGLPEETAYTFNMTHFVREFMAADEPFTVLGYALENALPDMAAAPYPLVIFSHGFTAPMWYVGVGEHLASYGFVVIAPEHVNDSWDNVYADAATRQLDTQCAIRSAEMLTAADGMLPGLIDVEKMAFGGHSAGGADSFARAGAPIYWQSVEAYCAEMPENPECMDLDQRLLDIQEILGAEPGADGGIPVNWDPRIDAIFPMAGSTELAGPEGLAQVTVPMMALYGTADDLAWAMEPAYDLVGSAYKAEVVFQNGTHNFLYNECERFPYILKYDLYWACSEVVWDIHRTHDISNHMLTAFLLDVLKGDADAHAALMPEAVSFVGVDYQVTMP